jgi:glycosyltransferase involved in cell wall biosynthesis
MKLAVISHKKSWRDGASGFATIGGFAQQMQALSELFDETTLFLPQLKGLPPHGATPLTGHRLRVEPLAALPERGIGRKTAMLRWMPPNLPRIWRGIRAADAIHTPIPGDIGTVGLLVALAQRKPLFVRHCSLWGTANTTTERFLAWLLPRIAGGRNVVLATGCSDQPPSPAIPAVRWIFSSSLREQTWEKLPQATPWRVGTPLRLVTVGRVEPVKNTAVLLYALRSLQELDQPIYLEIVGTGTALPELKRLASELKIEHLVHFPGNVRHTEVFDILARSHLFLLPSWIEGFPKAALEAMACGLPVIGTAVSALPALVGNRHGLLLKEPSAEAIVTAIRQLLAAEHQIAVMSTQARAASRDYTLERWRDTIGAYLQTAWGSLQSETLYR